MAPAAARFADEIARAPEKNAVPRMPAVMNEYKAIEIAGVEESAKSKKYQNHALTNDIFPAKTCSPFKPL